MLHENMVRSPAAQIMLPFEAAEFVRLQENNKITRESSPDLLQSLLQIYNSNTKAVFSMTSGRCLENQAQSEVALPHI